MLNPGTALIYISCLVIPLILLPQDCHALFTLARPTFTAAPFEMAPLISGDGIIHPTIAAVSAQDVQTYCNLITFPVISNELLCWSTFAAIVINDLRNYIQRNELLLFA